MNTQPARASAGVENMRVRAALKTEKKKKKKTMNQASVLVELTV
jgi:hypothetical protein